MGSKCCNGNGRASSSLTRIPKIDIHTHIIPKQWPDWNKKFGYSGWLQIQHDSSTPEKATLVDGNGGFFRCIDANCWSVAARLEECSQTDVDIQVLSTVPGVGFNYWAKAEDCLEVARFINDDIVKQVTVNSSSAGCKFIGLGTVPMQDPSLAVKELHRCVKELGMPGVQIGTHVNEWNLDAPELLPFWEAVSELDACVFVHPWDMREGPRYSRHWFPWLLDMPNETAVAAASMIMGGVYDRFPGLRVCFAHGGGSIAQIIGRIEHGFNARPDLCQTGTTVSPGETLRRIWVDSLVHDEDVLKLLIKKIGADKVILGSDYPFPLGEVPRPGSLIESTVFDGGDPEADARIREKLLYQNALQFFKLPANFFHNKN